MPTLEPSAVHLVVIAKTPVPGAVKTRLSPPYSPQEAAELADAALRDTLAAVAATPACARTLVLAGPPFDGVPPGIAVVQQRGGGLDERLAAAFDDAAALRPSAPLLLVGMDTPQVSPQRLVDAQARLMTPDVDAVLGPATDGGWWALGLRTPDSRALLGIPMSTDRTGELQLERLQSLGLRVVMLREMPDVDTAADAFRVATVAPHTRFAATLERLARRMQVS